MSLEDILPLCHDHQMKPAIYIMTNKTRSVLYTGVTSNLARRVWEHQSANTPSFTQRYRVNRLVYYETYETMRDAIERETFIKHMARREKDRLIMAMNPSWQDLSANM